MEDELEALKARYEQFFLGMERREPVRQREEIRKKVNRLKEAFTRNTGLRFRLQTLHARYLSYERLWMRSSREKEEGTYRRDVVKARLRARGPAAPAPTASAPAAQAAGRPSTPAPVPVPAKPVAAAAPTFSGTGEAQLRALYDAYVAAKRSCNEDVSRLSYDAVAGTVQRQVPELMARFKAKSVDFRVEVKDGKAVLKGIPRV